MLVVSVIGLAILSVLLWVKYWRLGCYLQEVECAVDRAGRASEKSLQKAEAENSKLRTAIEKQEELIAMLWFHKFGMEPADNGSHVPSGRLTQVDGLRPTLVVGDPIFAGDEFYFMKFDDEF